MEILLKTLGGAMLSVVLEMVQARMDATPDRDPREVMAEMVAEARAATAGRGPVVEAAMSRVLAALAGQQPDPEPEPPPERG